MSDPDPEVTDEDLAAMGHDELVAFLNQLYARCGEPALAASTAHASSDDELRDRIRGARRRVLARAGGRLAAESNGATPSSTGDRRASTPVRGVASGGRAFVVLVSNEQALARRARLNCCTRGVVLVWVASQAALATLVTSVTPTHVVIAGTSERIDDTSVRDLAARGARVRWCRGAKEALDAVAEIE